MIREVMIIWEFEIQVCMMFIVLTYVPHDWSVLNEDVVSVDCLYVLAYVTSDRSV